MTETTTPALTTQLALDAVAWGRAPRPHGGFVNQRIICADGFAVSVQASENHYASDSDPSGESPYWRSARVTTRDGKVTIAWPFVEFEIGNPSGSIDDPAWEQYDSSGVWAWVPRDLVASLLEAHGGAVRWEASKS